MIRMPSPYQGKILTLWQMGLSLMRLHSKWLRCEVTLQWETEVPKEAETEVDEAEEGLPFPRKGPLPQAPEIGTNLVFSSLSTRKSKLAIITKRVSEVNENWYKTYSRPFLITAHLESSLQLAKHSSNNSLPYYASNRNTALKKSS